VALESSQDLASDASPAPPRLHEHSLDLADSSFQFTNRPTSNRPGLRIGNKKRKPTILEVFWTKTVKGDAWISTTQILIEGPDEDKGIF
jgi:hypothetical protein